MNMKVHQFTRGFWEHEPSLSLGCNKRLRSLVVPKLSNNTDNITTTTPNSFDLKSFIRPECAFRNLQSSEDNKKHPPLQQGQAETHPAGGTRWNPTQEQIEILEMLYKGGMRTPNAQQIEKITVQLSKYGKIEGKNVFYWFQNHKARERQKQKRNSTHGFVHSSPRTTTTVSSTFSSLKTTLETPKRGGVMEIRDRANSPLKKCRSWPFEYLEDQNWLMYKEEEHKTLELFPLHPESS